MATFRKRGTTRPFSWEAQVRMRGWPTQTKTFPTKADAEQWASEREAEMRRGTFVDTSSLRDSTVHALLAQYLREVTPGKKGKESEAYRINALMRSPLARMSLDRLNPGVFVQWRNARVLKVANDTVRREMNLLSSVFSFARTEWSVPLANPLEKVPRPKQGAGRKRRPNWGELRKLLRELSPRVVTVSKSARAISGSSRLPSSRFEPQCVAAKCSLCNGRMSISRIAPCTFRIRRMARPGMFR